MIIKPLIQLRQTVETTLRGMTNIRMEMYLSVNKKINFTQMARFGRSCESRFRQNFRKAFDWIGFNRSFLKPASGNLVTLAIDPCFISKAGKKTPGIGYFWSGCASAMKRGLEILGIAAVDADTRQAVFLKAEVSIDRECYTLFWADVWAVGLARRVRVVIADCPEPDKKTQKRKVFFSTDLKLSAVSIFLAYRSRFQIEFCYRDAKQMTGLTHYQARNREALAFAFNMSLASVNMARAIAAMNGINLSVGSIKTLMHNASMLERFS